MLFPVNAPSPTLLLSSVMVLYGTETIRLIRDGRMEVGEEGNYIPIATLPPLE